MAGQIPRQFIDDLLARTDIVELIDQRVPLKKKGRNHSACCPFHNEKTPSFTVSQDKQFYHCFGCGAHGNAITFLMEYEQLEFPEAIEELAAMHHLEVPREGGGPARPSGQADDYELMQKVSSLWQQQLQHGPASAQAQAYLKRRGLSANTVQKFGIGVAPDSWDFVLRQLGKDKKVRDQLVELKLTSRNEQGREYDFFRNRLMFPIRDRRGRVIAFGGRVFDDGTPKYLNSPETRLFHKGRELYGLFEARQQQERLEQVLVVEGYMDVVALSEQGIDFAVASLGTATTSDHMQTLFRYCRSVVCCYDGDRAGRDAAWRALQNALPQLKDGVELKFVFLPDGEDPDSMVQQEGKEAFLARVAAAASLQHYFFEYLLTQHDASSDAGKSALLAEGKALIGQIPSEFYREQLSDKLHNLIGKPKEAKAAPGKGITARYLPKAQSMTPMRRAIALLLQYPALANSIPQAQELAGAQLPGFDLLLALQQKILEIPGVRTAQLLEHWRNSQEYPILNKLAVWDPQLEPEQIEPEFVDTFAAIEDLYLQQRLEALERTAKLQKLTSVEQQEYVLLLTALKSRKPRSAPS
ncbi:DNA primase [Alkalimonas mucilaginosa]|uniref:DNA primase n=1 Tax=Alkalimonas mucilaginosa TaxID=3057676 RepID=A0ABU7JER6_9GAMM|nr:DNA primase [Alkalimonas sp. MEB004]MEE2024177.1 DNA primase [Alkalimonas sp. MEB004]